MGSEVKSKVQMLEKIFDEQIRQRERMDRHIEGQVEQFAEINDKIGGLREDIAGHKSRIETRVGVISSGISLGVAGVVAWFVGHMGG